MKADLQIRDSADGLTITSTRTCSIAEVGLACAVSALVYGFIAHHFAQMPLVILIATAGAFAGYVKTGRKRVAELRACNLDFQTNSRMWIFGPGKAIPRMSIVMLEYRPGGKGHERGLYAKTGFVYACLLPWLDEPQTYAAIQAISEKFPDMAAVCTDPSPFGRNYTTLGL